MAIKIHHGPNGSYKTSGAIWDDAVPAAKEGRLLITNVRGVTRERFLEVFDDIPDSFDVLYISHETSDGMERIRTWFQWAPRNAFLIFDECQVIFPSKWNDKYLERFNYPGGPDKAKADDKPMDWLSAWTMHRHFNWDIVLTMPNIKYLHSDIRGTSEAAYQHSNLKLLGAWMKKLVGKDYKEAMHSAQDNKAPTDGSNIVQLRKIDKRVFKLYDSTATGIHRDTMAGKNVLASPRVLLIFGVLVLVAGTAYYRNGTLIPHSPLAVKDLPAVTPVAEANIVQAGNVDTSRVPDKQVPQAVGIDPYSLHQIYIKGSIWTEQKGIVFIFQLDRDGYSMTQRSADMVDAGYQIYARGSCAAELVYQGYKRTVSCLGTKPTGSAAQRLGAERSGAAGQSPGSLVPGRNNPVVQGQQTGGPTLTIVSDSGRSTKGAL